MDVAEKRQRDLALLQKSRRALDEGELVDRHAPATDEAEPPAAKRGDPGVVMYRGRVIRPSGPKADTDLRAIVERLSDLYNDGLITKSEFDRKRRELINRIRATGSE